MLYIYDKQNKSLMPCKETEFKAHGILERQDLAKWVEQYPEMLGEEFITHYLTAKKAHVKAYKEGLGHRVDDRSMDVMVSRYEIDELLPIL